METNEKIKTREEAKKWLKDNWFKLIDKHKLGEALNRYYRLTKQTAGEAYKEIKEIVQSL